MSNWRPVEYASDRPYRHLNREERWERFTHWCEEYAPEDLDTDSLEAQELFDEWDNQGAEEAAERRAEQRKEDRGW